MFSTSAGSRDKELLSLEINNPLSQQTQSLIKQVSIILSPKTTVSKVTFAILTILKFLISLQVEYNYDAFFHSSILVQIFDWDHCLQAVSGLPPQLVTAVVHSAMNVQVSSTSP